MRTRCKVDGGGEGDKKFSQGFCFAGSTPRSSVENPPSSRIPENFQNLNISRARSRNLKTLGRTDGEGETKRLLFGFRFFGKVNCVNKSADKFSPVEKRETRKRREKMPTFQFRLFILSLFRRHPHAKKILGRKKRSIFFSLLRIFSFSTQHCSGDTDKSLLVSLFLCESFFLRETEWKRKRKKGNVSQSQLFPLGGKKRKRRRGKPPLVNQPSFSLLFLLLSFSFPPFLSGLASSPSIKVVTRKGGGFFCHPLFLVLEEEGWGWIFACI